MEVTRDPQEIGQTHMKVLEGTGSVIQLTGLMARLCRVSMPASDFEPPNN
jgi:replication factor C subunit 2/4